MDVLLINPPAVQGVAMVREGRCMQRAGAWTAVWAPISLATIAAVLMNSGFKCHLADCIIEGLDTPQLLNRFSRLRPKLAVINTATPSIVSDLALAHDLKQAFPGLVTLAIGIHVSALPEASLALAPSLDAVVRAEPELTVREAAERLRQGLGLSGVAGLSLRLGDTIVHEPDREPADLERLPFPAWDLVPRDLYRMPLRDRPFLLVSTSRGCPYTCEFCADSTYYGKALRLKSPERIVKELAWIKTKFGITDFLFWAESFTLRRDWTLAVTNALIASGLKLDWVCNSRGDHATPEVLAKLKAAGCWMIGFGLESGSQKMLDLMGKRATVAEHRQAVLAAHAAGLMTTAHMVLGFPGETPETIQETIAFANSLPLDFVQFYCAVPFPGSELYRRAKAEGWIITDDWSRFEQNFSVLDLPDLKAAEVMAWRRKAYRSFYLRPGRILQAVRQNPTPSGLLKLWRMSTQFRDWIA